MSSIPTIAIDDPGRPLLRRAVFTSIAAACAFLVFTLTKEVRPLYDHAPWRDDPYDTVISFAMFFVPIVTAISLLRASLCRRTDALEPGRVVSILRGCKVIVGTVTVELLTAWVAVAAGANRPQWAARSTGLLFIVLGASTIATAMAAVRLARVPRPLRTGPTVSREGSDLIADAVLVAEQQARRLGPLQSRGLVALGWVNRSLAGHARRHPLVVAAALSSAFGILVFGWQGYREGYGATVTVLATGLGSFGMFGFLVVAGSYLGLVRSSHPAAGVRRRAVDATVSASAAAIAALAFRASLWWAVGSTSSQAGPTQFAALISLVAAVAFLTALAVEGVLHVHSTQDAAR